MSAISLTYPISVTSRTMGGYWGGSIVRSRFGYQMWSRLPVRGQFKDGVMLDASGIEHRFHGDAGFLRVSPAIKPFLEALLIPALLVRAMAGFVYLGPRVIASRQLSLRDFKTALVESWKPFAGRDLRELEIMVGKAGTFEGAISAVNDWRFNSGWRDEDGHPFERDEDNSS